MKNSHLETASRRKTPWSGDSAATDLQKFIDRHNNENYDFKHPSVRDSDESVFINNITPETCPYCGCKEIRRYGYTKSHIRRFSCAKCNRTFTALTGTVFDSHRIPISEWIEFCLAVFREQSFTSTSKTNKNSYTTTRYWIEKLLIVLDGIQDDTVLSGDVYIDETYVSMLRRDLVKDENGNIEKGLGRNQICIGIGIDREKVYCMAEGVAKPSGKRTLQTFLSHIAPYSHLIHDGEKTHKGLVGESEFTEEVYKTYDTSQVEEEDNPLTPINRECSRLKHFLRSHNGFKRDSIQGLLNLYAFIRNPPYNVYEKIDFILKRAISLQALLRFRDFYS